MNAEYVSDSNSLVRFRINNETQHHVTQHGTSTADFHECLNYGLGLVTAQIGDAEIVGIEEAVHWVNIGHPSTVNKVILSFLE